MLLKAFGVGSFLWLVFGKGHVSSTSWLLFLFLHQHMGEDLSYFSALEVMGDLSRLGLKGRPWKLLFRKGIRRKPLRGCARERHGKEGSFHGRMFVSDTAPAPACTAGMEGGREGSYSCGHSQCKDGFSRKPEVVSLAVTASCPAKVCV